MNGSTTQYVTGTSGTTECHRKSSLLNSPTPLPSTAPVSSVKSGRFKPPPIRITTANPAGNQRLPLIAPEEPTQREVETEELAFQNSFGRTSAINNHQHIPSKLVRTKYPVTLHEQISDLMAPTTRSSSSRAPSVAGPTANVGDDNRRSEQPAIGSRKQSTSTNTSERLHSEPLSGGNRLALAAQSPLQGLGGSKESTRPASIQESDHQGQSVTSRAFQEDGLQVFNEQNEQLEPGPLGLEHLRATKEGQTASIRSSTASESEKGRQESSTFEHDSGRTDPPVTQGGIDSSEELDMTVLPLDRELINPMFHHLKLYLDPIVLSHDKLLHEIQAIESLVKNGRTNRRIDSVQKAIMNLVENINDQVKVLNQHTNILEEDTSRVSPRRETPPHLKRTLSRAPGESSYLMKSKTPAQQKEQTDDEDDWSQPQEPDEKVNKGKNREITVKVEETPDSNLKMYDLRKKEVPQRRRLQAAQPGASKEDVIDKILDQCPGNLDHAVRSRLGEQNEFVTFTKIFEQVVKRTTIGREKPMNKSSQDWKTQATSGSNTTTQPIVTKPAIVRVPGKCDTCGVTEAGHDFRACRRKSKGINVVEQEVPNTEAPVENELEIIFHDDEDSSYEDGEYRAVQEESSQTADISNLEETFEVMDISCLEETDKRRPVFINRRNIVPRLGSPFLTTMCNSWKMSMLIDTGALTRSYHRGFWINLASLGEGCETPKGKIVILIPGA
ncbi:uncharacterized protein MELLADRAFT_102254 [Melampsora larici-populina 98AG31]|uniref:Uncharacterized protein n=1 Tax=Melampsora larici-populina (strain 98AG31 / pathotype 3-4-7) TaxID=747676 RepID=F4R7P6_MELLP|nr:uncharacterized protein MELLADRAFT_102254 [Melampsora larici-populina 98AG31]EGG11747.1 hypothetical protein MELLADRAFT_102254 [Melampsora larici-populina 98AG31]